MCSAYIADVRCYRDFGATFETTIGDGFGAREDGRANFVAPFVGSGVDRTLYFGTWRFWMSSDGGETWSKPAGDFDLTRGGDDVLTVIAPSPSDLDVIYTGSAEGRVLRSSDRGATWTDITAGLPNRYVTSIELDPADSRRVWVAFSGYRAAHLFGSTDGGATWNDLQANLPDIPVNTLWIDPREKGRVLVAGTDIGTFRTEDGGASWMPFDDGLPPVIVTDFAFDGTRLYAGTYGRGVYAWTLPSPPRRHAATH